ncbi:Cof-type HAD-IIB family hydrolase [Dysgonomonas macrotermitis]|uniref:Cof-type HAD-IIB family hydrolase n=1 Tax=Dysgonomonas macrotermitis TaxID=1346286 RepID=A0A1M4Y2U1_9BACT|nr:Cof-type HAD-IIB family hydrolase [Dysgonomonas macrotermitis]SHF00010.1 hypothetical protein SAMN05444362_10356 [Dysgonomonas macrotermitis]
MGIKQPKAIFFDIDGTLVSFKTHQIPESTIHAIDELRKKGIKVFIATGRSRLVTDNLGDIEFDGYVTVNGGYCTTEKGEVIYKNAVPQEDLKALVEYQKKEAFPCIFVREHDMFLNFVNEDVETILKLLDFPTLPIKDNEEALNGEILQLVAFLNKDEEERIMPEILPGCDSARWHPLFTDALARGNSKQTGIDQILKYYNIDLSETMAFGDGGNDIPMLKHVATSVAMGNAEDEVKAVADYVTTAVDDDGIFNALRHFGII